MLIETHKVDLITQNPDNGDFKMHLVIEATEVYPEFKFEKYLAEKLNSYASYFLDGQMSAAYPDLDQTEIMVLIQSDREINLKEMMIINRVAHKFREHSLNCFYERL